MSNTNNVSTVRYFIEILKSILVLMEYREIGGASLCIKMKLSPSRNDP